MERIPCVYIMTNRPRGTLYIGVTTNLVRRIWEHREGRGDGFTKKYHLRRLVWYEVHASIASAIAREKALKEWRRPWKLELIERENPSWQDLWGNLA